MHAIHPLAAALVLVAATGAAAQQPGAAATRPAPAAPAAAASAGAPALATDRRFLREAAQAGHAEIAAAQLALSRSNDAGVKHYARQLIDDHTRAAARLQPLATGLGVQLPAQASAAQRMRLEQLRSLRGDEFDRRFVRAFGVQAHRDAIDLFQREVDQGRAPDVRDAARDLLPGLRHHLQFAQRQLAQEGLQPRPVVGGAAAVGARTEAAEELADAQQLVQDAVQTVQRMKSDPRMSKALHRAQAVFILPHYGRGALGVGLQGGEGVLVARQGSEFGDPLFYNLGGVSIGAQAGGSVGPVALLLMTERAVRDFKSGKKFSLAADAGLTIADYSRRAQVSGGKVQDILVWSGTTGAYAGASVGVTDVMIDDEANRAYYARERVDPGRVIAGQVDNPRNNVLGRVLGI